MFRNAITAQINLFSIKSFFLNIMLYFTRNFTCKKIETLKNYNEKSFFKLVETPFTGQIYLKNCYISIVPEWYKKQESFDFSKLLSLDNSDENDNMNEKNNRNKNNINENRKEKSTNFIQVAIHEKNIYKISTFFSEKNLYLVMENKDKIKNEKILTAVFQGKPNSNFKQDYPKGIDVTNMISNLFSENIVWKESFFGYELFPFILLKIDRLYSKQELFLEILFDDTFNTLVIDSSDDISKLDFV